MSVVHTARQAEHISGEFKFATEIDQLCSLPTNHKRVCSADCSIQVKQKQPVWLYFSALRQ
ncbi:MAG: hypothetical protein DWH76_01405 [Planctomycetota bacterium]|nr:MAG: hypothetical protein DWH76_01405 [Planctomycetota bacterium]